MAMPTAMMIQAWRGASPPASSRTAVAATAMAIPAALRRLPLRAVAGEFIRIRPMTKNEAASSQASRTRTSTVSKSIA
jgi:hypothetical protein